MIVSYDNPHATWARNGSIRALPIAAIDDLRAFVFVVHLSLLFSGGRIGTGADGGGYAIRPQIGH
jgi:hypothetical protein